MTNDLTVGRPGKILLKFCMPLFISAIFQQFYNMADSIIAGRLAGENALSAIGASFPVTMIFMAIAFGCNSGCSVIISRLFGAGDIKNVKKAITTSLIAATVISAVLTIFGVCFSRQLMNIIQTPENILDDAVLYFKIYVSGFPFLFFYNIVTGVFTALGNSKTPLYFLIGSSLGNIALDWVFVHPKILNMGVAGAAWATFIAQGIACVLCLLLLIFRIRKMKSGKYPLFSKEILFKIGAIAIPSVLQQSCISIGNVIVQAVINSYGSSVIAGASAAIKMNIFATASFVTFSNGISAFASQNLGANKLDRVEKGFKSGLKLVVALSLSFTLIYCLMAGDLIGMFLKEEGKIALDAGKAFLWFASPGYVFLAVKILADGVLKGGGAVKHFMVSTFADLGLRVILVFILKPLTYPDPNGIWIAWPIGWFLSGILSVVLYFKGDWKNHKI